MCGVENALGFSIYGFDNFTPNSLAALKMFRAFVFLFVSLYTGSSFGALHQEHDRKEILTYGFIRDNFTKNAEQDQTFHTDLYNEIYKFIPGDSLKMYIWVGTRLDVEAVLEQTKDYLTTKCSAHIFGDYYQIHGVEIEKDQLPGRDGFPNSPTEKSNFKQWKII
eukprot:561650_1